MKNVSKLIKISFCLAIILCIISSLHFNTVYSLEDGAYIVGRTSTYVNPDTGLTSKGAASNATGENMSARILAPEVLVEQFAGRTYVTIGLGMASTISNVQIQIQREAGGAFHTVPHLVTGSSILNDDSCRHFRFEVVSLYLNISPKFMVDGMGMELEFYIALHMGSAVAGNSIYVSEMVPSTEIQTEPESIEKISDDACSTLLAEELAAEVLAARREARLAVLDPNNDPLERENGLSTHLIMRKREVVETSNNTSYIWIYIILGTVFVSASTIGIYIYKKKRGGVT